MGSSSTPMIPVEAGSTCATGRSRRFDKARQQSMATRSPVRVAQLALPAYEQVLNVGSQSAHSSYISSVTQRHFGMGARKTVDVSVEFYPSGKKVVRRGVKANAVVEIAEDSK